MNAKLDGIVDVREDGFCGKLFKDASQSRTLESTSIGFSHQHPFSWIHDDLSKRLLLPLNIFHGGCYLRPPEISLTFCNRCGVPHNIPRTSIKRPEHQNIETTNSAHH